jgi:hypothetical protein
VTFKPIQSLHTRSLSCMLITEHKQWCTKVTKTFFSILKYILILKKRLSSLKRITVFCWTAMRKRKAVCWEQMGMASRRRTYCCSSSSLPCAFPGTGQDTCWLREPFTIPTSCAHLLLPEVNSNPSKVITIPHPAGHRDWSGVSTWPEWAN